MDWREKLGAMVRQCADEAWAAYCRNVNERQYLWFVEVQPGRAWGKIKPTNVRPTSAKERWELASPDVIPRSLPIEGLRQWIWEKCQTLPIIGD